MTKTAKEAKKSLIRTGLLPKVENEEKLLRKKCGDAGFEKLLELNSPEVIDFVAKYVKHCNPDSVFVRSNSNEDAEYIRKKSLERGEEKKLKKEGHTVHYDGYNDQARDKENTKFLFPPGKDIGPQFNSIDRSKGLNEIHKYLENIMEGKEAFICFFCLGPKKSEFSIPSLQFTDSAYVAHAEDILYRDGYKLFKRKEFESEKDFFKFVHSAGVLENNVSKNIDKRRIYTDIDDKIVFSTNTQYGGNTIGNKKLSMRLAIKKASEEGWLTEHMFIMGVKGPGDRITYFSGAYPSACGKTSTAMSKDSTLIGDDIAYLREIDNEVRAVNPENGIFGIIRDVNPEDDPVIWRVVTTPGEVIFTNVLVKNGVPYWIGMGKEIPDEGINHSGKWYKGKKDSNGELIDPSHRNARYTLRISDLEIKDPNLENPDGVKLDGIIYGGRDSDTWVPVEEAYNWDHGILTKGALLESETTSATLGKSGSRRFNPMSNLDFLSISIGKYIENQIEFGKKLNDPPSIFSANYFLKDENGNYLNGMHDKKVWLKWMELRTHNEVDAIETPTGFIPKYNDLKKLFDKVLGKKYSKEDYEKQFTIRVPQHLSKLERVEQIYSSDVKDVPKKLFSEIKKQRERLKNARDEYGDYISPFDLEE